MESTFGASPIDYVDADTSSRMKANQQDATETICEEEMLDAFRGTPK
jgi:hypothetical protein